MHAAASIAFAVLHFGLKLELGPEFDSNANRAEIYTGVQAPTTDTLPSPIPSFLLRGTAAGTVSWITSRNSLRLGLTGAGKIFFAPDAQPQNVAVAQAVADDALRVAGPLLLGLGGDYYDAAQWIDCPYIKLANNWVADTVCHRDFRTANGRAQAAVVGEGYDVTVAGGGRFFTWKPDDTLSFEGAYLAAAAGAHFRTGPPEDESEWDVSTNGRVEWRGYHGPALTSLNDPGTNDPLRRDFDAVGSFSIAHVGKVYAALAYTLDVDRSSSFGQSYLRHVVVLKLGFDLPFHITATTKAQLVVMSYPEPLPLTSGMGVAPLSIDDENRNGVLIDLDRPIGAGLAVSARYSYYRNGSGVVLDYTRHVAYLGLSYRLR